MPHSDPADPVRPVILVVDDTPEALRFLTATLEQAGMSVLIAIDGLAALDSLKTVVPDLILMDAVMPRLDGFETTRRIKDQPGLRHLPIIFMTGLTETEHVVRGLSVGGVDFVSKPIVVDELLARIRVHLATARVAHGSQLALDTSGRPALAVDRAGTPQWLTPAASLMLERLFPGWSSAAGGLPDPVRAALRDLQAAPPAPGARIAVAAGERTLEATLLRCTAAGQWVFRLAERHEGEERAMLAAQHGLTAREAEVLLWISRGKQNREISDILQISPRTVNKHLEQIFEKMGVENRASATAIAVTTLTR
ncbi:response regulator transcription factor [Sphingomonas sp. RIT328]|uniref:response regulator transcription factor n=1 Tax=Sphingomonas sp. RIT328 TaxID=1470591 RepID=UPI000450A2CB|nr:DNA-binding response regulator [Sphingomonas sp. RIT328]EZP55768.1 Two component LuxR family transcriptional regulator [Sphingomonas sp. RIT328]